MNSGLNTAVGFVNPTCYAAMSSFFDVTVGNNVGYKAAAGWDPCTGVGVLNGALLAAAFSGSQQPPPVPVTTTVPPTTTVSPTTTTAMPTTNPPVTTVPPTHGGGPSEQLVQAVLDSIFNSLISKYGSQPGMGRFVAEVLMSVKRMVDQELVILFKSK